MARKNTSDFYETSEELNEEVLLEQESDYLVEEAMELYSILNLNFYSLNESDDESALNLLLNMDETSEDKFFTSICEEFDLDPYDLSDNQLTEIFGFLKKRKAKKHSDALVKRMTRGMEGDQGPENAKRRARAKLKARRISREVPDTYDLKARQRARAPKGSKVKKGKYGQDVHTASVYRSGSGKNNPDKMARSAATTASGGQGVDPERAKSNYYASVRQNARNAQRKARGQSAEKRAPYEKSDRNRQTGGSAGAHLAKPAAEKPAASQRTARRFRKPKGRVRGAGAFGAGVRESQVLVRNSRIALAERVLSALKKNISELNRSEKFLVRDGQLTMDDVAAARDKRHTIGQRHSPRRGVKKVRGKETPGHGVYRRLAGTRAAEKAKEKKHAKNKAEGNVTKVNTSIAEVQDGQTPLDKKLTAAQKEKERLKKVRAKGVPGGGKYTSTRPNIRAKVFGLRTSTEIVKKGRMALAEKVLSELSQGALERYRAKAMSQDPTTTPLKREKGISKASTKITRHKQGKSTPKSMFGGSSNQTSTTAGGGTLGSELAKTKPETQHSMNRRGTSTVDKKQVAANLADAKSGRNTASLAKEIAADNAKRAAAKRAEG